MAIGRSNPVPAPGFPVTLRPWLFASLMLPLLAPPRLTPLCNMPAKFIFAAFAWRRFLLCRAASAGCSLSLKRRGHAGPADSTAKSAPTAWDRAPPVGSRRLERSQRLGPHELRGLGLDLAGPAPCLPAPGRSEIDAPSWRTRLARQTRSRETHLARNSAATVNVLTTNRRDVISPIRCEWHLASNSAFGSFINRQYINRRQPGQPSVH